MTPAGPWEQRWHPFREEWVLFTAHRGSRPWVGETRRIEQKPLPAHDPTCALCPGNRRLLGATNPDYRGAWWFPNDLPCFAGTGGPDRGAGLYRTRPAAGTAEVICYHPRHDRSFAQLTGPEVHAVADLWKERTGTLMKRPEIEQVLIFENRGEAIGTSNPHPHGQLYAGNLAYGIMAAERDAARRHAETTGMALGLAVLERELDGPRIVCRNESFVACVPWFARYAYEVIVLPTRSVARLDELETFECHAFGELLREVAIRYDNLWQQPMPYVLAIHQAPRSCRREWHYPFHAEFHPPLRNPNTMKYLAGPEIGGGSMTNESNPDEKAAELRAASSIHYNDTVLSGMSAPDDRK